MRFRDIEPEIPGEIMPVRMHGSVYFVPVGGAAAETPHDVPLFRIYNRDHFRKHARRMKRQKPH